MFVSWLMCFSYVAIKKNLFYTVKKKEYFTFKKEFKDQTGKLWLGMKI